MLGGLVASAMRGKSNTDDGVLFSAPLRSSLTPDRTIGSATPTFSRASAGDYLNSAFNIAQAATDAARFDWGQSGETKSGLLIEPQATNLLLRSEEIDNASWVPNGLLGFGSGSTANATTAPDGTATADYIRESSANTEHRLLQGIMATAAPYTLSCYFKASQRSIAFFRLSGPTNKYAYFNLSNGTVGTVDAGATAGIVSVGNGWYRCWITATLTATSWNMCVGLTSTDGVSSYTGDGASGLYAWGAVAELGSSPTAYIPTVASTVTRAADSLTYPAAGNISYQQGSIGVWVWTPYDGSDTAIHYIFDGRAVAVNGLTFLKNGTNLELFVFGAAGNVQVSYALNTGSRWLAKTWHYVLMTYDGIAGTSKNYLDGVFIGNGTPAGFTAMAGINPLFVGQRYSGAQQLGGRLRDLTAYNRQLSASEVSAIYSRG